MIYIKTIFIYLHAFILLIKSLPKLRKVRKLTHLSGAEKAEEIFKTPIHISKSIIEKSKSTLKVTGLELIPDQPVLFVANHQGLFDILLLLGYLERPVGFIAKEEIKKIPIVNKWMIEMKCVFIDRSNRRAAIKVIDDGIELLNSGQSMVIFPEGTRGKGREINPFKSGSLRLATRSGVPIVPVTIDGTYQAYEKNNRKIKASDLILTVSEPIYPEQYENMKHNQLALEIEQVIAEQMPK